MTPKAARIQLALTSPSDQASPEAARALEVVEEAPNLAADVERQFAADRAAAARLAEIIPSPASLEEIADIRRLAREGKLRPRFNPRDPAMISVVLGFLLLVGLLTWNFVSRQSEFPDEARTIADEGIGMQEGQFEAVDFPASELADWFLLKGFDTFRIPPAFANFRAAGARLARIDKQPVAFIAVPERLAFFIVFDPTAFGIAIEPEGSWRVTELDGGYAAAITQEKGTCFMVVTREPVAELRKSLRAR